MKLGTGKELPTFFGAKDVMELIHCSQTTAYKLISNVNDELASKGFIVPKRGVAPSRYLLERLGVL